MFIAGYNPVVDSLSNADGNSTIAKVYLRYGLEPATVKRIRTLCRNNNVSVVTADKQKFARMEREAGLERNSSNGVLAMQKSSTEVDFSTWLETVYEDTDTPIVVILDGITDPQNLGAIARSAAAAGCAGIITAAKASATASPAAHKASAGALERISLMRVQELSVTIKDLKNAGFTICGSAGNEADIPYTHIPHDEAIALIIGAEGDGMSASVSELCDLTALIPMHANTESLNASVAAGIMIFEVMRRRL